MFPQSSKAVVLVTARIKHDNVSCFNCPPAERWQEGPRRSRQALLPPHPADYADHGAAFLLHGGMTLTPVKHLPPQ